MTKPARYTILKNKRPRAPTTAARRRAVRALTGRGIDLRLGASSLDAVAQASDGVALATDLLALISATHGQALAAKKYIRVTEADVRRALHAELLAMTDQQRAAALLRYRQALGEDATQSVTAKDLETLARREADREFPPTAGQRPLTRSTRPVTAPDPPAAKKKTAQKKPAATPPPRRSGTAFDDLTRAARSSPEIENGRHTHEKALATADPRLIALATKQLQDLLFRFGQSAGLSGRQIRRVQAALATVQRSFANLIVGPTQEAAYTAVRRQLSQLDPDDPVGAAWRRLGPWLEQDLGELVRLLTRFPPVSKLPPDQLATISKWRIGAAKGAAGELVALNGAYRRTLARQIRRARRFQRANPEAGYKLIYQFATPLRATTQKANAFALSYDNAVLLINTDTRNAIVVHAAQFKAGDISSLYGLAQTGRDNLREQGGQLLIDGVPYIIKHGQLRTHRTIVGMQVGAPLDGTAPPVQTELANREVDIVAMLIDPEDLHTIGEFVLTVIESLG
jgi:hypothetical protein